MLIEAGLAGLATVATRSWRPRRDAPDGVTGLLVDIEDKPVIDGVRRLVSDRALREGWGKSGPDAWTCSRSRRRSNIGIRCWSSSRPAIGPEQAQVRADPLTEPELRAVAADLAQSFETARELATLIPTGKFESHLHLL